jgi:hypothetical protein
VDLLEEVGGAAEVRDRELEEQRFGLEALLAQLGDLPVVIAAAADRLVEDRGVGGEAGHVEIVDVALQRAVVQDPAGDVVEPEALPQVVELLGRVAHVMTSFAASTTLSGVKPNFV